MSYTSCSAVATCTVAGLDNTRTAALAVYDYLVNHPDEIPDSISHDEDAIDEIESYLYLDGENLTISYDSESDSTNHNSEVFDFLSNHFACLQTSPYMEVHWSSIDSRTGTDGGTSYYDRQGQQIDVHALLIAHLY
jgi:hypothetical protein